MNEAALLCCPLCRSTSFYIEDQAAGLIFFSVTTNGHTYIVTRAGQTLPERPGKIYCTSCAWYGEINELEPPFAKG